MEPVGFDTAEPGPPGVGAAVRLHQVLLASVVLLPALLFAAAAWQNHEDVLREGRDAITRTTAVMQEHARKVFETAELALGRVDERVSDETWAAISAPETSEFLARLKAPMEQVVSIWIADADGAMRAGSQAWPPGSGIAARDFFQAQKAADLGTYIAPPFTGAATATPSFAIIRRRSTLTGVFDGTIHVAASPEYFSRFYAEIAPPYEHAAALLREDGMLLARDPPQQEAVRLGRNTPLMQRIVEHRSDGNRPEGLLRDVSVNGREVEYAFRRVGNYPVYVVFSVPHDVLLQRWYKNLQLYGLVAGGTALTLLAVSWLALRRARAEQVALVALREESRQRQAAESQLRHAQRMDAVGQLTGGVAHDFNNLLTAILGNLEMIARAPAGPEGEAKVKRLAGVAMRAVSRGSGLTKSLLAFSRKQPMNPEALDANALLDEFMELVRQGVGARIAVDFQPQPGLPRCVADAAELEAAVLNLSINARDAMPEGGRLDIRTAVSTLDATALEGNTEARPGRFVSIAVADTGQGMPPEVAQRAFEPFFTTKPIGQGTGLGLSQVYGFVRQLGGHVTVASAPGDGDDRHAAPAGGAGLGVHSGLHWPGLHCAVMER